MPERGIPIESWAQETIDSLSTLHISALTAARPISVQGGVSRAVGLRGTSVALDIPLDEDHGAASGRPQQQRHTSSGLKTGVRVQTNASDDGEDQPSGTQYRRREPLRRDSLKRREALLRGKEGSRRRQKWENDRLIGNPHVVPPEPHDWQPRATHPIRVVPYYLAPLWDERKARASEAAASLPRGDAEKRATQAVPRELRERLKRSRAAKSLLQNLEEQVRQFVETWAEHEKAALAAQSKGTTIVTKASLGDSVVLESDDEGGWTHAAVGAGAQSPPSSPSELAYSTDSDDEIVFIGRKALQQKHAQAANTDAQEPVTPAPEPPETDKLVFDAPASDQGASFGRWLLHNIAEYYSLRAWSVTTTDRPARREAYIGIPEERSRFAARLGLDLSAACRDDTGFESPANSLPRPLWGMV